MNRLAGPVSALVAMGIGAGCADLLPPEGPAPRVTASVSPATSTHSLYATTSAGGLVAIDLAAGTATLVGDAGTFEGRTMGWTGLSFDAGGTLYVSSRQRSESTSDGCTGFYIANSEGRCSHLYVVDPGDGSVIAEVGSTGSSWISDIDFGPAGTLYGIDYFDTEEFGDGGLVSLDPAVASRTPIGRFDAADASRDLEYGGLTVTASGEIWGVENEFAPTPRYLFRVDPTTGAAIEAYPLFQGGTPVGFGMSALESLPDGRLIAARARGAKALYEIVVDASAHVATLLPIAIAWPSLPGGINGLESRSTAIGPADLMAGVEDLVNSGSLASNKSKSLLSKIDQAARMIELGRSRAAINVLGALLNQLDALVASGDVTEVEVGGLRGAVEAFIAQLSG